MEKAFLIINPVSRHGKAKQYAMESLKILEKCFQVDVVESEYPGHAKELAEKSTGYKTIISAGGDGTVHEIVNGMMSSGLNEEVILSILPVGTGNDSARSIGMPFNHLKAAEKICQKKVSQVDVGKLNNIYFSNSLGLGMDARVAQRAIDLKGKIKAKGLSLYLRALFDILSDWETYEIELDANGYKFKGEITLIASNIGRTYGGGFFVTPRAYIDDGLFDVCLVKSVPVYEVPFRLPFIIFGKHLWMKKVSYFRARKVVFSLKKEASVQLDGEVYQVKEGEISLLDKALTVHCGDIGFFKK